MDYRAVQHINLVHENSSELWRKQSQWPLTWFKGVGANLRGSRDIHRPDVNRLRGHRVRVDECHKETHRGVDQSLGHWCGLIFVSLLDLLESVDRVRFLVAINRGMVQFA